MAQRMKTTLCALALALALLAAYVQESSWAEEGAKPVLLPSTLVVYPLP